MTDAFSDFKPIQLDVLYAATDDLRRFTESEFRSSQFEIMHHKSRKIRLCIKKVRMCDMIDVFPDDPDHQDDPDYAGGIVRYVFDRIRLASSGVTP